MTLTAQPPTTRPRVVAGRYDGPLDLDGQFRLADRLATAGTALPEMYRGHPGDVLATMYQAQALDVAVMVALQNFVWGENGRGAMSGQLMAALILRAGHTIEVLEASRQIVEMRLVRCDGRPDGTVRWTEEEAVTAGLFDKTYSPWIKYQADMLWWRCLSRLARRFAADVVMGMGYVPEELDDDTPAALPAAAEEPDTATLEVAPDVQALLDGAAEADTAGLHRIWSKAYKGGLFSAYAGTFDGRRLTVEQYLLGLKQAALTAGVQEPDLAEAGSIAEDPGNAAEDGPPVTEAPAGVGVLDCGCSAREVIMGGVHRDDCPLPRAQR